MNDTDTITAPIAYLVESDAPPEIRVFPPSSGKPSETPENIHIDMVIEDARSWPQAPTLDEQGFELYQHVTSCTDFYNEVQIKNIYYPETAAAMKAFTGASEVFIFDHNTRSAVRVAQGQHGVRPPVDASHVDYTETSGPKRVREILEQAGRMDLDKNRAALINLWRPIIGPVLDVPLALCDARTVALDDLIDTRILHYVEDKMTGPNHDGLIYSLQHNPNHRWSYVSAMQADEVLLLKCYDSLNDGRARFTPHTGFKNPACPTEFTPRESIELRTLVIYKGVD